MENTILVYMKQIIKYSDCQSIVLQLYLHTHTDSFIIIKYVL